MNREEVILVIVSVLGSAITFAIPIVVGLWKIFAIAADLRMQIAQNRHDMQLLDERYEAISAQTVQRFDHFSNRFRGEVHGLNTQVRELQNFLSKTTNFEVRSQ